MRTRLDPSSAARLASARARASGDLEPLQGNAWRYRERLSRALARRPGGPLDDWVSARLGDDRRARLSYLGWLSAGFRAVDAVGLALELGAEPAPGPDELGRQAWGLAAGGVRPT